MPIAMIECGLTVLQQVFPDYYVGLLEFTNPVVQSEIERNISHWGYDQIRIADSVIVTKQPVTAMEFLQGAVKDGYLILPAAALFNQQLIKALIYYKIAFRRQDALMMITCGVILHAELAALGVDEGNVEIIFSEIESGAMPYRRSGLRSVHYGLFFCFLAIIKAMPSITKIKTAKDKILPLVC